MSCTGKSPYLCTCLSIHETEDALGLEPPFQHYGVDLAGQNHMYLRSFPGEGIGRWRTTHAIP